MSGQRRFLNIGMSSAFALFLISLTAPLYIVLGGENTANVIFSRIPGMDLRFTAFDGIAIVTFFLFLTAFFACHALYERHMIRRIFSALSALYSVFYLITLVLVATNGLVINNFPVISIPLWVVVGSKFFILLPIMYFFCISADRSLSAFVRTSALLHSLAMAMILFIKIFEIYFIMSARAMVFEISISLYFITLAMVTFFMYRKYYSDSNDAE